MVVNAQPEYDDVAAPPRRSAGRSSTCSPRPARPPASRDRLTADGSDQLVVADLPAIFLVELPDKTFIATLVLATKYRPLLVWIGVGLAFSVQTTVAVLVGHAVSFLPEDVVQAAARLIS